MGRLFCPAAGLAALLAMTAAAAAVEPPRAALPYRATLTREAHFVWGLNAPLPLFAAQIHQESAWQPRARSAYAAGLAQFTPDTADWMARRYPELGGADVYNPQWAMRALLRYDHWLYQQLDGADDCEHWAFVLSAYNGGLGWVQRDRRKAGQLGLQPRRWFGSVETVNAGRAGWAFKENRSYPRGILLQLQPRYLGWGPAIVCEVSP